MCFAILSDGAVAQLGERHVRNVQVGGSSPLCSTKNERGGHVGRPLFLSEISESELRCLIMISI
jgi:hypothetical protein